MTKVRRQTFFYKQSVIAPAVAAIGHAEIASNAPKTNASIANSQ